MTSKPDFKVMILLLVFMQLTRDLFAIAKFLLISVLVFMSRDYELGRVSDFGGVNRQSHTGLIFILPFTDFCNYASRHN